MYRSSSEEVDHMGSSKADAGVSLMQNLRRNHWQKARQRLGKAPRKDSQRPGSGAGKGPAGFRLYRIGDAVEARNIHAAIYEALRLVRVI